MGTVTTTGHWTGTTVNLDRLQGVNTPSITWGVPYNRWNYPSGYLFTGVTGVTVPLDGAEFILGTFTHSNFTITGTPKFQAHLQVAVKFDPWGLSKSFNFTFDHTETPNVGDGNNRQSDDLVVLPTLQSKETVVLDGTEYALSITGFRQNGSIVGQFRSPESQKNSAEIFAKLVVVSKPPPPPTPTPTPAPVVEEKCRVKQVVSTTTLFTTVIERLNRRSATHLIEQLIAEVNAHCEKQPNINIDVNVVLKQIEELNAKLTIIQNAAKEIDDKDLGKLEELLKKLLAKIDIGPVIQNLTINVDGRTFSLVKLTEVLATVDQVVSIEFTYTDPDDGDITGVIFELTDGTKVIFHVRIVEGDGGKLITYVFETKDWKGVPASFSMILHRGTRSYKLCNHNVSLGIFSGIKQTNIVFDLCPQIRATRGEVIPPPPFDEVPPSSKK